ncbi:AAA family ATPase [Nonomuraea fastidiosa]|uniref:helix-turn-helix transcriptional regulator n=1 Tax=Nonomuraea fastidiosa TaxID=46173 RepID=UPI00366A583C
MPEYTSDPAIVGRDGEIAEIMRRVAAGRSHVLVLSGEPGAGKSAVLDVVAGRVRGDGGLVLRVAGSEPESRLGFAGLHQLLRPVLGELDGLPPRQRCALRAVLGLDECTEAPDGVLTGSAVLTLISRFGASPLLVVVDDAQWIDRASLDVLSFVARRLDAEPVTLLVGVRSADALPGFDTGYDRLELGPLDGVAANRLLDLQPQPPVGRHRVRVLQEASGNPLALIELARVRSAGVEGPLPVTDRLERIYAEQARPLPESTRRSLLLLAAADAADFSAVSHGLSEAFVPAEEAGLVRRSGPSVSFRHPLIRSAVYHAAPFEERRQAHLALARLSEEPDRRAWHLAAAATGTDAEVSDALRETADRARRRGGYAAAAAALERAAELSPRRADRARLLAEAAELAVFTGQLDWVERLVVAVRAHSDDPELIGRASLATGKLMALRSNHTTAFALLTRIAAEASFREMLASSVEAPPPKALTISAEVPALRAHLSATKGAAAREPHAAAAEDTPSLEALAAAAVVRYYSGEEAQRRRIESLLAASPDGPLRVWVEAVSDPHGAGSRLRPKLPELVAAAEGDAGGLTVLAVVAWLLDQTALAVKTFDEAYDRWRVRGALPDGLGSAVGWAYLDHGRWAEARTVASEIAAVAATAGLEHAEACAYALDATVLALRGETDGARRAAERALALVDPLESRSIAVAAHRALGLAAVADGDYEAAYTWFGSAFTGDGDPVHYHVSPTVLAELAASAARLGRRGRHGPDRRVAELLERAAQRLGPAPSPRLAALLDRGRALLAEPGSAGPDSAGPGSARPGSADPGSAEPDSAQPDSAQPDSAQPDSAQPDSAQPDSAEPYFQRALAGDAGEQWPFERAQTRLDYGEWLRRRRRITEARPQLAAALETFRRLGARPWAERAEAELRAAGVEAIGGVTPDVLTELSPQQQQIVRLAARGLTNREIGDRLHLSPRTVGSHLYRVFPKLGVTARAQLRDVLEGTGR